MSNDLKPLSMQINTLADLWTVTKKSQCSQTSHCNSPKTSDLKTKDVQSMAIKVAHQLHKLTNTDIQNPKLQDSVQKDFLLLGTEHILISTIWQFGSLVYHACNTDTGTQDSQSTQAHKQTTSQLLKHSNLEEKQN